ncbi:MAG: hypothetical protein FWE69_01560 [Clostridiales bacterium]|nr:hypothetical protein [Clostridiales bacterium]
MADEIALKETYYPVALRKEEVSLTRHTKLPLEKVAALGTAFEPLAAVFQQVVGKGGGSGLYRVTVPRGGQLAKFQKEPAFLGTVLDGNRQIAGQARLNQVAINPAMLFMAAALMSIDKKLDSILETQQEILAFLEQKEKAKQRGNYHFLTEILQNYKHNWANETYKRSNHIKVLDIKQDAEHSILFYREQIERKIKKQGFLHSDKFVKDKLAKVQAEFKEYQMALYLYAFSSFLETLLLENYEAAYLDGVGDRIEGYALQYRELHAGCCDQIEGYAKSSVQSHLLSGLANINKFAGETAAKIPLVNKSQLDETLTETSHRLGNFRERRTEQTMERLADYQIGAAHPFVEDIKTLNRLHNQHIELLFDQQNLYLGTAED